MGYVFDETMIPWGEKRMKEIGDAYLEVGCAIERLESVPADLRAGAILMDNQPEADVMRSFAMDVERLTDDLKGRCKEMMKDRDRIRRGIRKYEEGKKHGSGT